MRRLQILKILTLMFLLLSLATGICAAKDESKTFIYEDEFDNGLEDGEKYKYYIDESKTKIIDYEGRIYLQIYWKRTKVFCEPIWFVPTFREGEKGHWTEIFDVGQRKSFVLEYFNKDIKPKEGRRDISEMKQNLRDYSKYEKEIMKWMVNNRWSILEQINTANGEAEDAGFYEPNTEQPEIDSSQEGQNQSDAENVKSHLIYDSDVLKKETEQIDAWLKEGKIKAYNAGAGFEWRDEKARMDFEALPFSDDIQEVASHVYRFIPDIHSPERSWYVVMVPRHVCVNYENEQERFDSLTIVRIAERNADYEDSNFDNPKIVLEPCTKMIDMYYIREGKTDSISHTGNEDEWYTWKWLEEGEKESLTQENVSLNTLANIVDYTFEGTEDPGVTILNGISSYGDTVTGRMEVLPGVVTTLPPWYEEQ